MKTYSRIFVSLSGLTLMMLSMACRPAQKDPPFAGPANRQDVDVSRLQVKAENPLAWMGVPELWTKTSGKNADGSRTVVALVGTGIDYTLPELRDALWINTGEMGDDARGDLVDNDRNGYADDVFGYDFQSGDGLPFDWHGHDTYIASLIASAGKTNASVVGAAPNAAIMAVRYLGADGTGAGLDAAFSLEYAVLNGARIIYFNWPSGGFKSDHTNVVLEVLKAAGKRNVLVIMPAGNTSNKDVPALISEAAKLENVIIVGGTDEEGKLTRSTNYGQGIVSVAAPSEGSIGLYPGGEVANDLRTTSVAAGYVAGAAALIATLPGKGSAIEIKKALLATTDERNGEDPLDVLSQGVLNLSKLAKK